MNEIQAKLEYLHELQKLLHDQRTDEDREVFAERIVKTCNAIETELGVVEIRKNTK